jgi:hypothetical protein
MSISALVGIINFLQLAQPNKYPGDAGESYTQLSEAKYAVGRWRIFFVLVKQLLIFFLIACVH